MVTILFLISSLNRGGAESQLIQLMNGLDKREFECVLCTSYNSGTLLANVGANIRRFSLHKRNGNDLIKPLRRAIAVAREVRPQLIYSFEEGPNLVALFLARIFRTVLVWGIRNCPPAQLSQSLQARVYARLSNVFFKSPNCIIFNSYTARRLYGSANQVANRAVVITNGFDSSKYRRLEPPTSLRAKLASSREILIGHVGSFKPDKDHPTLIRAFERISSQIPNVRYVLVGGSRSSSTETTYREKVLAQIERSTVADRVRIVDETSSMVEIYNVLDLFVLASRREGCPNAIGEAMLCEVPVVTTAAGDAEYLLGSSDWVVPVGEDHALAERILSFLTLPLAERRAIGNRNRKRIESRFVLQHCIDETACVLKSLVDSHGRLRI